MWTDKPAALSSFWTLLCWPVWWYSPPVCNPLLESWNKPNLDSVWNMMWPWWCVVFTWSHSSALPSDSWSSSTRSLRGSWSCRASSSSESASAAGRYKCLSAGCWPGWPNQKRPSGSSGSEPSTLQSPLPRSPGRAAGPPRCPPAAPGSVPGGSRPGRPPSGPAGCLRGPEAHQDSADGSLEPTWWSGCGKSRGGPHCSRGGRRLRSCSTAAGGGPARPSDKKPG